MRHEDPDREGLVDWPDGRDWHCVKCGAVHPEATVLAACQCGGQLTRVNRAYYFAPGERVDVVVQYAAE
jgi:hypothetical protein